MGTTITRHVHAKDMGSLEQVLYGDTGLGGIDVPQDVRLAWFVDTISHHIETNSYYGALAANRSFTPTQITATGSLADVPLLPAALYKHRRVESATRGGVQLTRSSGTQGSVSIVARDQPTLERFVGSVLFGVRDLFDIPEAREVLFSGPHANEADDIWFSYVLTLVGLLHETHFAVRDGELQHEKMLSELENLAPDTQPAIVGPPSLLHDFLSWMADEGRTVNLAEREPFVLTAGGWKKRASEHISRSELTELIWTHLGIAPDRVRDAYNAVELNTVTFECDAGYKHIPPWLEVQARRPSDLSVLTDGGEGLLSFVDATALSYPAIYLSDDIGYVQCSGEVCGCGRPGPVFDVTRRVQSAEQRGCGLSLNRYARPAQGGDQ